MNGKASLNAGQLLAGEYFGYDSDLWEWGVENFNRVYDRVMQVGMIEMNSPIYSLYHYPPVLLAQVRTCTEVRPVWSACSAWSCSAWLSWSWM